MADNQDHITVASLGIYGDGLCPDIITKIIGREPSARHKKGDPVVSADGKKYERQTGAWILFSNDFVDEHELSFHLDFIFDQFSIVDRSLITLPGVQRASLTLATCESEQVEVGGLSNEQLWRLANLGVDLKIDIYS